MFEVSPNEGAAVVSSVIRPETDSDMLREAIVNGKIDYYTEISALHSAYTNPKLSDDEVLLIECRFDFLMTLGLRFNDLKDGKELSPEEEALRSYYERRI